MGKLCGAVVAVIVLAFASTAEASVTFGANLNRVPVNLSTFTCGAFYQGVGSYSTFDSCSWEFQEIATGESVFPPSGLGVISRVRVRVGATTGPMQVVVEEAYNVPNPSDPGHPGYVCCRALQLSQVFTPTPNAVTTVPVNFTVRSGPDPATGVQIDDHLALSVLARNVPIPASQDSNAYDGVWFPAWQQPGEERYGGPAGTSGAVILFNADWDPAGSGTGGGTGTPAVTIGQPKDLKNGTATLPVTVPGAGLLNLVDDRVAGGAAADAVLSAAAKKARVKSVSKTVTSAGNVVLKITPSKSGRRALKRNHKLKVTVLVSFIPAGSKTPVTHTVALTLKLHH